MSTLFSDHASADAPIAPAATPPQVTAMAPWFGCKRKLAPVIVSIMRPHRCYWEPFVGGFPVIIAKEPCPMETVNDLHGEMINLARCVAHPKAGTDLYKRLRRTWAVDVLHDEAAERWKARGITPAPDEPDVDRAYDYFLCSWLGRNGVAGTQSFNQGFSIRYTANGGHAAKRFGSAVDSIPAWRRRMRNVTILNRNGFDLIGRIEDESKTVIYLDPPYVVKGAKYTHDFEPQDHARLRAELGRFTKAQVIVSYYDCPAVRELYDGWTFHSVPTTKAMVNQGMRDKKGATVAPEVLIVNGGAR